MIGSPPGYIGHEAGGILTEAVKKRPYQIVLFDEFEKAHKDVSNILLQVLDEGTLTDGRGRKGLFVDHCSLIFAVDFKNTIIILTSNLGSQFMMNLPEGVPSSAAKKQVMEVVSSRLSPEFINRIGDFLLFNKISRSNMNKIVEIQLNGKKFPFVYLFCRIKGTFEGEASDY